MVSKSHVPNGTAKVAYRFTLRADIDYGFRRSETTYGIIGIKVWPKGDRLANGDAPVIDVPNDDDKKTPSASR